MSKLNIFGKNTKAKFQEEVFNYVVNDNLTFIEAVLEFCKVNGLEPESVANLVDESMKARIRAEAQDTNLLPPADKLDI